MHLQRIAILIAAIAGTIGVFLPFMKALFFPVSLIDLRDGSAYIIIIAFIASSIVALIGDKNLPLKNGYLKGTIISGIIPGVWLLFLVIRTAGDKFAKLLISLDIGFYLVCFASAAILLSGLTLKEYSGPKSTSQTQIFCTNCGKEYSSDSEGMFCAECGNKL